MMYKKGFPAGIYYDGTIAFIGRNNITTFGSYPVRLDGATNRGYFTKLGTNESVEEYSLSNLQFLEISPNLVWKTVTASTMASVANVIKWPGGSNERAIGRIRLQNSTVIGKVISKSSQDGFYYNNPLTNKLIYHPLTENFELLTCAP